MLDSDGLLADAELLFDAVREAGSLAMTMLRQNVRRWSKADGSPVTEADLQVDALLASRLRATRLSYGWLSEESQDDATRTSRAHGWIVDPIDGTRSFVDGGGNWCVAAALVSGGRPVIAAIYRPVGEEFYSAILGRGAMLNGHPITMGDGADLAGATIIGTKKSLADLLAHDIVPDSSGDLPLQLRLAYVADSRAAGAVSFGAKNDWDLAAGDLLVHEAGGRASNLAGQICEYNRAQPWQQGMVASSARRHAAILSALGTA